MSGFCFCENGNLSGGRGLAEDVVDDSICFTCSSVQQRVRLSCLAKDDVHSGFLELKVSTVYCNLGAPPLSVSALKFSSWCTSKSLNSCVCKAGLTAPKGALGFVEDNK